MTKLQEVQAKNAKLAGAFDRVFTSPDGQAVMADLELRFNHTTLKKHNGVIDPNASIAAAGCREVLLYIQQMRNYYVVDG
jgi:hypothetical protein